MNLLQFQGIRKQPRYSDKQYLDFLSKKPCIVCGQQAQLHHAIYKSAGNHSGDLTCVPLCAKHHTGSSGVHALGRERFHEVYGIDLSEVIWSQLQEYFETYGINLRDNMIIFLEELAEAVKK